MPSEPEKKAFRRHFCLQLKCTDQNQDASDTVIGHPVLMNLGLTQERWPDIVFHETREHSVKL
ncbi:peptide chain release factor [Neisseria meningitidis]|uniref:peptide chain release factor n=1 Tax=Neisseria meningitidis TaxID=487 RepID=UPI003D997DFF